MPNISGWPKWYLETKQRLYLRSLPNDHLLQHLTNPLLPVFGQQKKSTNSVYTVHLNLPGQPRVDCHIETIHIGRLPVIVPHPAEGSVQLIPAT